MTGAGEGYEGRIRNIWSALRRMYGPKRYAKRDPLDELILTILSQNTTDANRDRAFRRLKDRFSSWGDVVDARPEEVEEAIWSGGLAHVKARRIQEVLRRIKSDFGEYSLAALEGMKTGEGLDYLLSLDGVGEKTARCVLLFGCGRGVFPVDTHIHRVARRLGLIGEKAGRDEAHEVLGQMIPPELSYEMHINMIQHGRSTCKARNPRCEECELAPYCRSYKGA
ncbi:MAG TPA: endonuclease III [Firmicutes bacterium]|nr:endonuclease III [Bacillota bacterium]